MTFEQAAAVPLAAMTALRSPRDAGRIQPGQKVLVNGVSGGIGTFPVQIAKSCGAEVTGVCNLGDVLHYLGEGPAPEETDAPTLVDFSLGDPHLARATTSALISGANDRLTRM